MLGIGFLWTELILLKSTSTYLAKNVHYVMPLVGYVTLITAATLAMSSISLNSIRAILKFISRITMYRSMPTLLTNFRQRLLAKPCLTSRYLLLRRESLHMMEKQKSCDLSYKIILRSTWLIPLRGKT